MADPTGGTHPAPPTGRTSRRLHVQSFVFGLLFTCVAASGTWYALGHHLDATAVRYLLPSLLIVVGLLGMALARRRT